MGRKIARIRKKLSEEGEVAPLASRKADALSVHDLRGVESDLFDVREAGYANGIARINAEAGKSFCLFLPLNQNPFVKASRYLVSGADNSEQLARDTLVDYYKAFERASLSEIMNIPFQMEPQNAPRSYELGVPFETAVSPWNHAPLVPIDLVPEKRQIDLLPENRLGDLERLKKLIESTASNGYQPHDGYDGDIAVDALWDGSQQRFVVLAGTHRVSVLVALGHEIFPVRVRRLVRRGEVELWPKVKSGTISRDAALAFFDQFFDVKTRPTPELS